MKKECKRIRRALPNYLNGHLFRISRIRIERHLEHCVVCRSEFEALRHTEETRQILKDINAPDGVVERMREGVSSIRKFKKILYRPLWMAGLVLIAGAVYFYVVTPRQLDLEIERIVKTEPTASTPLISTGSASVNAAMTSGAGSLPHRAQTRERLVVTILADDETAIQKINEFMNENDQMRKLQFSDSVREIDGSLSAKEFVLFFRRINLVAKVSYSRKRFESFPATEQVPFIMRLAYASRGQEQSRSTAQPVHESAGAPVERATPATQMTAPPHESVEVRSEATVPHPPKTAPSQTALP